MPSATGYGHHVDHVSGSETGLGAVFRNVRIMFYPVRGG